MNLCFAISICRDREDLYTEEMLFNLLIQLFRSPESLILWTALDLLNGSGSSSHKLNFNSSSESSSSSTESASPTASSSESSGDEDYPASEPETAAVGEVLGAPADEQSA